MDPDGFADVRPLRQKEASETCCFEFYSGGEAIGGADRQRCGAARGFSRTPPRGSDVRRPPELRRPAADSAVAGAAGIVGIAGTAGPVGLARPAAAAASASDSSASDSSASHSKSDRSRHRRPAPWGQRRKTAEVPSRLRRPTCPRQAVRQSRSRPEVFSIEAGSGPPAPTTKPPLAASATRVPSRRSRSRKFVTVSSWSPHALTLMRSAAQHGFGSSIPVPEHAASVQGRRARGGHTRVGRGRRRVQQAVPQQAVPQQAVRGARA